MKYEKYSDFVKYHHKYVLDTNDFTLTEARKNKALYEYPTRVIFRFIEENKNDILEIPKWLISKIVEEKKLVAKITTCDQGKCWFVINEYMVTTEKAICFNLTAINLRHSETSTFVSLGDLLDYELKEIWLPKSLAVIHRMVNENSKPIEQKNI